MIRHARATPAVASRWDAVSRCFAERSRDLPRSGAEPGPRSPGELISPALASFRGSPPIVPHSARLGDRHLWGRGSAGDQIATESNVSQVKPNATPLSIESPRSLAAIWRGGSAGLALPRAHHPRRLRRRAASDPSSLRRRSSAARSYRGEEGPIPVSGGRPPANLEMAETEGFEPSVGVIPLRRFSKPLVSATHPRLRDGLEARPI